MNITQKKLLSMSNNVATFMLLSSSVVPTDYLCISRQYVLLFEAGASAMEGKVWRGTIYLRQRPHSMTLRG